MTTRSAKIHLSNGLFSIIDEEDIEKVSTRPAYPYQKKREIIWFAKEYDHTTYAVCSWRKSNDKWSQMRMHRLILDIPMHDPRQIDHIDGDGLNNRKSNLRICTQAENARNIHKETLGVCWSKASNKWRAQIGFNYKSIHLGVFENKRDAIIAYNKAAKKYFGEYACLNQI